MLMHKILNSPWDDLSHPVIPIVEDSDEDFYVFERVLQTLDVLPKSTYNLLRFRDGDEVLNYLFREGEYEELQAPPPAAILLDLNLPGTDGREVIVRVKQDPNLKTIPIIVLTTSSNPQDVESCYRYGANSYLVKPMGVSEMQKMVTMLFKYWLYLTVLPSHARFPS